MGVFGKKDSKNSEISSLQTKQPSITYRPAEVATTQAVTSESSDIRGSLTAWIKSAQDTYSSWKSKSCEWCDSPQMKELNKERKQFATNFCHPLGDFYRSFPQDLTEFKESNFGKYNQKERLFSLEALTLLTAIVTLRAGRKSFGITRRFMLAIRNSTVTFLLGGLLLAPEIYNPLIKSDF